MSNFVIPFMTRLGITDSWGPILFKLKIMLSNLVLEGVMEGWGKLGRGMAGGLGRRGKGGEERSRGEGSNGG